MLVMKRRRAIGGEWLRRTPFLSESTDVDGNRRRSV
jgi:hypothetical protein